MKIVKRRGVARARLGRVGQAFGDKGRRQRRSRSGSGGACLVLLTKPCVKLADRCQRSMLKIQDQRRSLLKTLRGHRPPEVFGRGLQRQAQTRRRAKAGRGMGRQQIKVGFLLIWGLAGLGQAWLWLGAWFGPVSCRCLVWSLVWARLWF